MGRKPKVEKEVLPTMTKEELYVYLKDNHKFFTITEMAEETAYSMQQIKTACDNYGLVPITMGERVRSYIECNQHLTLRQQAEKLDMKMDSLKYHYKQLGYDHTKAGKGEKINPADKDVRMRTHRAIRDLSTYPVEYLLGPIARKYMNQEDPMEIINRARLLAFS